ncbi:hypothetical protein GCM10009715_04940 [Paeniglutamicibacter psychrophenolicus]|uniref:DUF6924 domain-containing protein n=1 Tax=Paeniglutamicibacter psychrophenolicus TaxID=257454 RepID=A0ABS4WDK7_9MICC|nr:hypothetical protein [Paeniglutamicibacter psychrophenolicus]MBP2374293.1 hypothetical protein [Paeniglutamicibacter psychrophenolicus]
MKMLPDTWSVSPLVRLDFTDQAAWGRLLEAVGRASEEGFLANLSIVDDPAFDGAAPQLLRAAVVPNRFGPTVFFAADRRSLADRGYPVLVIDLMEGRPEFRCVASELWAVESNLNIANLDWEDFVRASDASGVFRGFA